MRNEELRCFICTEKEVSEAYPVSKHDQIPENRKICMWQIEFSQDTICVIPFTESYHLSQQDLPQKPIVIFFISVLYVPRGYGRKSNLIGLNNLNNRLINSQVQRTWLKHRMTLILLSLQYSKYKINCNFIDNYNPFIPRRQMKNKRTYKYTFISDKKIKTQML